MLVERAPVGGAASDGGHRELGPVARAAPARVALVLQVAHVRPALSTQLTQRGPQGLVEAPQLLVVENVAPLRIEGGPPEDLVGQEVADAGETVLIHQASLERGGCRPARWNPQRGGQLGPGHGQGIGTQLALVG